MPDAAHSSKRLSREEVAAIEVGRTAISPIQKFALIATFLSLILAVPVVQTVREVRRGGQTPEAAKIFGYFADAAEVAGGSPYNGPLGLQAKPSGDLLDRTFTANAVMLFSIDHYEQSLTDSSFLTRNLVGPAQYLLTRSAGAGNEKAYPGRDGWLFFRPGVDYCTGAGFLDPDRLIARAQSGTEWRDAPQPDPLLAIFQLHAQLLARDIRLVVMPTPVKPVVHPEKFTRRYENYHRPVQNPSYQQMLDELAQPERFFDRISAMLEPYRHVPDDKAALSWYGPLREAFDKLQEQKELILSKPVIVYDPAPAMVARRQRTGQDQFLRTDTHWTPQAMAAVADGLAGTLQEAVGIDRNPGRDFQRETTQVEGQGDIAVMMQLPDWQDIYPPQAVRVEQVLQGETFWRPDPSADVLLLGDSFSNIYSLQAMGWGESAGLAEQLSYRLGRSIDAIRRNDAGAHATREMLSAELARGIDRLAGKKVVVWQFASRELAVGDWRVDSTPMQLGQRSMSDLLAVEAGKPIELVGRVLSATPAPRPGSVNYAEHVIHLHLGDLQAVDGSELPAGEALAATMSMRQGQWTPAARYRPGQQVHMRMYNFEEYDANYSVSGFNSSVPDDPDLMLAQPVWGEDLTDPVEGAQAETEAQSLWPDLAAALGVILAVCLTVGFLQRREGRKYHDEIQ